MQESLDVNILAEWIYNAHKAISHPPYSYSHLQETLLYQISFFFKPNSNIKEWNDDSIEMQIKQLYCLILESLNVNYNDLIVIKIVCNILKWADNYYNYDYPAMNLIHKID